MNNNKHFTNDDMLRLYLCCKEMRLATIQQTSENRNNVEVKEFGFGFKELAILKRNMQKLQFLYDQFQDIQWVCNNKNRQ